MKNRKINYIPGMISLILLPALCVWYLNKYKIEERCVELSSPKRYIPNQIYTNNFRFDTTSLSLPENKRNYVDFELNGDIANNYRVLDSFNSHVIKIFKNKDIKVGLHINIKDNTPYSFIIKIIDICQKDSFKSCYCFYDNGFWYFHRSLNKIEKQQAIYWIKTLDNNHLNTKLIEGCKIYTIIKNPEKNTLMNRIKIYLMVWPFFLILILFSIISIRYIRNNYIKTNHKK